MAARDRVDRITRAEDNGWSASMDENNQLMGELRDAIQELSEERAGGGGGFFDDGEWSRVRVSLIIALLLGLCGLAGSTYLTARDNADAVQRIEERLNAMPSADVLRRLGDLEQPPSDLLRRLNGIEDWQRAHTLGHP